MIATVAIVGAALIVVAAIEAPVLALLIGRMKRNRPTFTDYSLHRPEVPEPVAIDIPADADDAEVERLVLRAWFDEIMRPNFPNYRRDFSA